MTRCRGFWPAWLASCIVCGVARGEATYRRHGMCKRCDRLESLEGRAPLRRVQFRALKRGGTTSDALGVMVLEIAETVGVSDGALMVGTIPFMFKQWASGSTDVPPGWEERIAAAWIAVERGDRWRVYE